MAKGHRSQIKRERNEVRDTRPSAKLSYARVSVQKACFVLDAIRGKDVQTALAMVWFLLAQMATLPSATSCISFSTGICSFFATVSISGVRIPFLAASIWVV